MPGSVGKILHDARVQRGISIEEAAHATKVRPDKIEALEHDDYARFANRTYAKSFLQIYGRYLGIDVAPWVRDFEAVSPISVDEYQYLTNGLVRREPERATFSFSQKKPTPSIVPLFVFAAMAVIGVLAVQFYVNWQRVTAVSTSEPIPAAAESTAATTTATPTPADTRTITETAQPAAPADEEVAPAASPALAPVAAAPEEMEVLVAPIKKTWIIVRQDDPKSAPIFEDFLYPDARPLKIKGANVFIEARDPSAIVITKNGAPIAYAPGAAIR